MRRRHNAISTTLTMGGITVGLSIFLLVGWIIVILQNSALTREVAQNTWWLVAGVVSLATIISVLMLFCALLVRETLEIRRQDTFIDSVTHELKSPLASLKLCLETLGRAEVALAQREELRQMMLADVERLSLFIDDVLEASRLPHGRPTLAPSEVALASLVARCKDAVLARYRLPEGCIEVSVDAMLRLTADRTALETIIKNLLDNAAKYSERPARIHVRASVTRRRLLCVEVQDHGIGVPAAHLKRIFERFYRVPDEAVRARHGTGLGLFVVSALVRRMGGRLEALSPGVGKGTTLRVLLPLGSGAPT